MQNDEQAIRDIVTRWIDATKAGDLPTVLTLMADDVLFMVPGREPFGKDAFIAGSKQMKDMRIDGTSDIQEIKVLGDWAWLRNRLQITVTPPGGNPILRSGYTLTVLRKQPTGRWVVYRDANLVS